MKYPTQHLLSAVATVSAAALFAGTSAWAQEAVPAPPPGQAAQSVAPGEAVPLPDAVQGEGGVAYVTGGVVYEELPAFNRARSQYPLNIEIYQKAGSRNQFTADAEVKLLDRSGKVLVDTRAEGPYLWAKVPPGQYKVQTTLNGLTKEQRVSVGSQPTRAIFVFPPESQQLSQR